MSPSSMRWTHPVLTAVVAVLSIGVFGHWIAVQPPPVSADGTLPLLVELAFRLAKSTTPGVTQTLLALVAAVGIAACVLALVLTVKIPDNAAARRLAASLAWICVAVAYFYFVWPYPDQRGILLGESPSAATRFAADFVGYLAVAAGLWQLGRFFELYPRPIAPEDWKVFIRSLRAHDEALARQGWRARVYPRAWLERKIDPESTYKYDQGQGPHQGHRTMALLVFGAAAITAGDAWMRSLPRVVRGQDPLAMVAALVMGVGVAIFLLSILRNFRIVEFHHARGLPDDRLRIEWIYSTMLAAGLLALGVVLVGLALFFLLVVGTGQASVEHSADAYMMAPMAFGVPFFSFAFLASVAASIFYRGAVDPRLAARKVTVWWLLGAAVAILFVFVERAVAVRIVQWLGMPSDSGYVLAGALVAGTVAPIRKHAEELMTALVGRVLPIEQLMDGERRVVVVAMCDLSGYTALSVKDEKQALLIAALLHRNAAVISKAQGGRLVKSIGDAVMLEFPDADRAACALAKLHAEFPAACRAMGFEPLPVHSGAHLGEVVVGHDGDLFGQTVNLAARLQGEAKSGQIVVSDAFIAGRVGAPAEAHRALGPRRLKNIPDAVDCHELVEVV